MTLDNVTTDAPEKDVDKPLTPNTTEQQDITKAGQRKVNLIWEYTQAIISLIVVIDTMVVSSYIVFTQKPETSIPTLLAVAFGMITGFYFARTNHVAIGGVGPKDTDYQEYKGR